MVRYSQRRCAERLRVTGMGYRGTWDSTDQVPARAIADGRIDRFGTLDTSDGGDSYRYSGSVEWQRTQQQRQHEGQCLRPRLRPQPVLELHLLPRRPGQRRPVPPGRSPLRHRRARSAIAGSGSGAGRPMQNTVGVQLRHDDIGNVGLYHTERAPAARAPIRQDARAADQRRRLRARTRRSGRRGCGRWPACASTATASTSTPASRSTPAPTHAGLVSPKGGAVFGPWRGTELYVERRARLPQQRRARRDHHDRPGDRRAGAAGDAAGPRHAAPRSASARVADSAPADER